MKPPFIFAPVLLSFAALLSAHAPASGAAAPDGGALYRQRCQACHAMTPGKSTPLGPTLAGVIGRKAASAPGYTYSPALRASNLVWTRAAMDGFLASPMRTVPGTRMAISVPDPQQRAALINFLAAHPAARP